MQAEYKPYQPLTSEKETVQVGINALNMQQQAVSAEESAKQKRLQELLNLPFNIAKNTTDIFEIQEGAILKNYEFNEAVEKNAFLDQMEKIDLDNTKPAIEKANEKKVLTNEYKQARQIRRENLKKNNNFLLGKSEINLARYEEEDNIFFNALENDFAKNRIALENAEKTQNRNNVINNLSTLSNPNSVYRNLNLVVQDIDNDSTLTETEKTALKQKAGSVADKAVFDLNKTNFLNIAYQGNPELGLQQVRAEINKLQNENYQPNLTDRGKRIEELLIEENKIKSLVQEQEVSQVVSDITLDYVTTPEQALQNLQENVEYKKAVVAGDLKMQNLLKQKLVSKLDLREDRTADFTAQLIGTDKPQDVQRTQEYNGYGHVSSLTETNAKLFKLSYAMIGKEMIGSDGAPLTGTEKMNRFLLEQNVTFDGALGTLKESRLHLDGVDALAVEAHIRNLPISNELIGISTEKHKQGGLGLIKEEKELAGATEDYFSTPRGKSLRMIDRVQALKEARAFYQLSARTGRSIEDLVQEMQGSNVYIVDENSRQNIIFDSSKYNEDQIKYGLKELQRNPDQYLNIKQIELTQGEKFDMRGNSVTSIDGENVYMQLGVNNKLGKPLIGKIKMSDLPKKPLPVLSLDQFSLNTEKLATRTQEKNIEAQEKRKLKSETEAEIKRIKKERPFINEEFKIKELQNKTQQTLKNIEKGGEIVTSVSEKAKEAIKNVGLSLEANQKNTKEQREFERKLRKGV